MRLDPVYTFMAVRQLAYDEDSPLYNAARCIASLCVYHLADDTFFVPPDAIPHANALGLEDATI